MKMKMKLVSKASVFILATLALALLPSVHAATSFSVMFTLTCSGPRTGGALSVFALADIANSITYWLVDGQLSCQASSRGSQGFQTLTDRSGNPAAGWIAALAVGSVSSYASYGSYGFAGANSCTKLSTTFPDTLSCSWSGGMATLTVSAPFSHF